MYSIKLQDLLIKAPVGLYPEEKILGTDLVLHIELEVKNNADHSPNDYVDYTQVYEIIIETLKSGFDLLEQAADAIIQKLFSLKETIVRILISIEKVHPPVKQFEGKVSVTISKSR